MSLDLIKNVENAASELCRAGKVRIISGDASLVVSSCEFDIPMGRQVIITPTRAAFITGKKLSGSVVINNNKKLPVSIQDVIGLTLENINESDVDKLSEILLEESDPLYVAALKLAKIGELVPALVVFDGGEDNLISVRVEEIDAFAKAFAEGLKAFCVAPLTLENALDAEITVFKSKGSIKEHYAITVGNIKAGAAPVVRIHSCCFTGDILASMKCDCRDQLQESLRVMSEDKNGGILLYLMQEGRGIGLVNKLRTYSLQEKGFDTVEANKFIGFEDDERPFLPAAKMLQQLGINQVRLLTNNPRKVEGVEGCGIKVVERVGHLIEPHKHNEVYMDTKFQKLGHLK
jgi:GTP cyclohydrolase II